MNSKVTSCTVEGIDALAVDVEVDISNGLPSFNMVGLPEAAVRESKGANNDAKLALGSLSAVGRLKATSRVGDATQLMVIKNIAEDRKEFKEFVSNSMPHLMPSKLLTRPRITNGAA